MRASPSSPPLPPAPGSRLRRTLLKAGAASMAAGAWPALAQGTLPRIPAGYPRV